MLHNLAKIMLLAVAQITISTSNVSSETQRNCSFLEDYYFQQENAVADTLDCLEVGYSPNVVRSSDKSTIFHLIAKSNIDGYGLSLIGLPLEDKLLSTAASFKDDNGNTPLMVALDQPELNLSLAMEMMSWPEAVNASSVDGNGNEYFPINKAVERLISVDKSGVELINSSEADLLLALLAFEANPKAKNSDGKSPLDLEMDRGHRELIELLFNPSDWFEAKDASTKKLLTENNVICPEKILSEAFITENSDTQITACIAAAIQAQKNPKDFWLIRNIELNNILQIALRIDAEFDKILAVLLAAQHTDTLDALFASYTSSGQSLLHLATQAVSDYRVIFALVAAGADVDEINNESNSWFSSATGTTPMHVAAKRKNGSGKFIAALKILGGDANIFDNNLKEISDGDEIIKVGQLPLDYLNKQAGQSISFGTSFIKPRLSNCEVVDAAKEEAALLVGIGSGAAAGTTIVTTTAGITAVAHSSGAIILTGSAGYIGGTLGTIGASTIAALTAPATLIAAGTSVIALGGAVYYCSE